MLLKLDFLFHVFELCWLVCTRNPQYITFAVQTNMYYRFFSLHYQWTVRQNRNTSVLIYRIKRWIKYFFLSITYRNLLFLSHIFSLFIIFFLLFRSALSPPSSPVPSRIWSPSQTLSHSHRGRVKTSEMQCHCRFPNHWMTGRQVGSDIPRRYCNLKLSSSRLKKNTFLFR